MAVTSTSVLKILCFLTIINVTSEKLLDSVHIITKDTALVPGEVRKKDKHQNKPVKPTVAARVEYYDDFTELLPNHYHPVNVWNPDPTIQHNKAGIDTRGLDLMIMRAKSNSYYLPPILKSGEVNEKLNPMSGDTKSEKPVGLPDVLSQYSNVEYHMSDEDDVKTSPRSVYGNWPSYHYTPYETEQNRKQAQIEKAKDKRHIGDEDSTRVIPIHEDLSHDVPTSYVANDNPLSGNDPFFSFVLNDYIDDKPSDDQFTFKGASDWDNGGLRSLSEDFSSRNRRIGNTNFNMQKDSKYPADSEPQLYRRRHNEITTSLGDLVTEKGIHKGNEFRQNANGDNIIVNDKANYKQGQQSSKGNKDFLETFANKVDGQDHRNNSKFSVKKNEDNGEKIKGFHRIYRIDEYKEDKEFYKNSDNNAKLEENGTSNTHAAGSKGVLGSSAAASISDQSYDAKRTGNIERNQFGNYLKGQDMVNNYEKDFRRYRDAAKQAALSNNMDYSDRY